MRSVGNENRDKSLYKLNWKYARESKRGRYEVVEVPLLSYSQHFWMDEETLHQWEQLKGTGYLQNNVRFIVQKDLKTGKERGFIALFVGTMKYMKKAKSMQKNSYLFRQKDFDGSVFFFTPEWDRLNG